jgi:hypothetical protein
MITTISEYQFQIGDLKVAQRKSGISAFVRVKNGEDFLRQTVVSHIPFFDEIIIVYNDCQDNSAAIIAQLLAEFPSKIKAFHYLPKVSPLGVQNNGGDTMANYSNFALAQTSYCVATKLDDDHIAIESTLKPLIEAIRANNYQLKQQMWCFSGLNLFQQGDEVGVLKFEPMVGSGDHGYFEVTEQTYFYQGSKFELFKHQHLKRVFKCIDYLHLKHLKQGSGFLNYDLSNNPDSRYVYKKDKFDRKAEMVGLKEFFKQNHIYKWLAWMACFLPEKLSIILLRRAALPRDCEANLKEIEQIILKIKRYS